MPDLTPYAAVISYRRFSSAQQASGASEARQQGLADDWAAQHGITLSPLSCTDKGLSGYAGTNLETGELGQLLKALQAGAIPTPALLLLEAADRFGRRPPIDTLQTVFGSCLQHGMDLLLLDRNLLITRTTVNADVSVLIRLALEIDAAHKYSERLSNRMLDAHQRGREAIKQGKPVRLGWLPRWITWNGESWQLNDYANTVRRLLELSRDYGSNASAQTLNSEGHLTPRGKSWTTSTVEHLLSSPAVAGGRPTKRRDEDEIVWGYFPELISREEWQALRLRRQRRGFGKGSGGNPGICLFVGQRLTRCVCGGAVGARVSSFTDRDGQKQHRRYVRCRKHKTGECHRPAVRLEVMHAHLLVRLQRGDLAQLFPQQQQDQAAAIRAQVNITQDRLEQQQAAAIAGKAQIARMLTSQPDAVALVAEATATAERHAKALSIELVGLRGQLSELQAASADGLAAEVEQAVQALLQAFSRGVETEDQRRGLNLLLKRMDLRVTLDAETGMVGLAVGDGEPDWQQLNPALDQAALQRGMVETTLIDFEADDELMGLLKRLPGDAVKDLSAPLREALGGDDDALIAQAHR